MPIKTFSYNEKRHPEVVEAIEREGDNFSAFNRRAIIAYGKVDDGSGIKETLMENTKMLTLILDMLKDGIQPIMPDDMGQEPSNWEALENLTEQL